MQLWLWAAYAGLQTAEAANKGLNITEGQLSPPKDKSCSIRQQRTAADDGASAYSDMYSSPRAAILCGGTGSQPCSCTVISIAVEGVRRGPEQSQVH